MKANILTTKQRCADNCHSTWRYEHGASQPGGPFPGTMADPGDVRRCEHGKYWKYRYTSTGAFFNKFDRWERLSWLWTPVDMCRAWRALNQEATDAD
ncbi:hypothetical protein [Nocardia niwae]|uniref:hypothetical protein n=1 Tax=Nocardia niwae TaxID=626084 RepID=UPI0007A4C958|nr:hypothetical protein [Nocardia niwae]